jgi:hypothetical protein
MKNRILSVTFDKASLPLSPNADFWTCERDEDRVIFRTQTSVGDLNDYTRVFKDTETASLVGSEDQSFTISVELLDGADKYKIAFSVLSLQGSEQTKILFDAKLYMDEYAEAAASSGLTDDELIDTNFEGKFNVAYMKTQFAGVIEGNDQFWKRLSADLDTVCAPINCAIAFEESGEPLLPAFIKTPEGLLPAFKP